MRSDWSSKFGIALLLGTLMAAPTFAQTAPSGNAGGDGASTLDLTLDTGAPPAPQASPTRIVHRSLNPDAATRPTTTLASRGGTLSRTDFRQQPSAAPRVLAQLGMVSSTSDLSIRVERDPRSRLLSTVPHGTYLAVVADGGDWWGVLMVNNTMGWVPKPALQLIDYRAEVAAPVTAAPASPTPSEPREATGGAAGSVGGLTEGLDNRTVSLLREAMTYLGVPYVWAGNTRAGLDCSGFVKAVFASQGVSLPRHSGDQARIGQNISGSEIRPGDRLYFDMGRKGAVSHCGIYMGNGYFIHASTNHGRVDIDSIFKPNYYKALVSIRRS